ncbi:hypothetical protein [Kordia sp.]|uniref:hypothetical protein n=1 Tax=Kordia sp. TaxID=1965332 RepID=UPI003D2DDABD
MKSKTHTQIELKKRTIATVKTTILSKIKGGQCIVGDDTEPIHIDRPSDAAYCNH